MANHKVNKLIFSITLTAVISLPLMIPGCTPFSPSTETNTSTAPIYQTSIQPFIDMATIEAASQGQPLTLESIMTVAEENKNSFDGTAMVPTFTQYDNYIEAQFDNGDICKITIKNASAKISC